MLSALRAQAEVTRHGWTTGERLSPLPSLGCDGSRGPPDGSAHGCEATSHWRGPLTATARAVKEPGLQQRRDLAAFPLVASTTGAGVTLSHTRVALCVTQELPHRLTTGGGLPMGT